MGRSHFVIYECDLCGDTEAVGSHREGDGAPSDIALVQLFRREPDRWQVKEVSAWVCLDCRRKLMEFTESLRVPVDSKSAAAGLLAEELGADPAPEEIAAVVATWATAPEDRRRAKFSRSGTQADPHVRVDGQATRSTTVHLPVDLHQRLRVEAASRGVHMSAIITEAVRAILREPNVR